MTAGFADAGGAAPFKVTSDVERSWLDVEIGLDVVSAGGVSVGVGGFGQFASNSSILGGDVRLSIPF